MRPPVPLVLVLTAGALAAAAPPAFDPVVFEEVAAARGLRFVTNSGRTARKHQPETMVSGIALFDLRRRRLARRLRRQRRDDAEARRRPGPEYWNRLFRNDGKGIVRGRDGGARAWPAPATTWASPPATSTTTGAPTCSWRACSGTRSSATAATGPSTDVTARAGLAQPDPSTARCGPWPRRSSTTTTTAGWTCSSPTTACGIPRTSPSAAARARPTTAIPSSTRACPNSLFHNDGNGALHRRLGDVRHPARTSGRAWASAWPTSTTTAGWTCSSRTTPCPRSSSSNNRNGTFTESAFERAVAFTETGGGGVGHGRRRAGRGQRRPARRLPDGARERDVPALPERRRRRSRT